MRREHGCIFWLGASCALGVAVAAGLNVALGPTGALVLSLPSSVAAGLVLGIIATRDGE